MRPLLFSLLLFSIAGAASAVTPIAGMEFTDFPSTGPVTAITSDRLGQTLWYTSQPFARLGSIDVDTKAVKTWDIRPPGGESVLTIGSPQGIVVAPDNNVYFPVILNFPGGNGPPASAIVKFDPAREMLEFFKTSDANAFTATIAHITAGPDAVYVTRVASGNVQRMSFDGSMSVLDVTTSTGPRTENLKGIAFAEGKIWLTGGFRSTFEMPANGGLAIEHRITGGGFLSPRGMAGGSDGMYVVLNGTSAEMGNRVVRIAFQGGLRTTWELPTRDSGPVAITAAPNGKFYITEELAKQIAEFDPNTGTFSESPVPQGRAPLSIAAPFSFGPDREVNIIFNSFAPGSQDGVATLGKLQLGPPGDGPDLLASVDLGPGFGPDEFVDSFRAGSLMTVVLEATNLAKFATTGGTIELEFTLPNFASDTVIATFSTPPGTCTREGVLVRCVTSRPVGPNGSVEAFVSFPAPSPPAGAVAAFFDLSLNVKNFGDVNLANNKASRRVQFLIDRELGLVRLPPQTLPLRGGRQ